MFYYRLKKVEIDGEISFQVLEHKNQFTKEQFSQHLEEAMVECIKNHPKKLHLLTKANEKEFTKAAFNLYPILNKLFGYKTVNVELTVEYHDEMKEQEFLKEWIYEEGYVNYKMDYRYLFDRKLRKRGKESLKDREDYIYRIKEIEGSIFFYSLMHKNRFSKEIFLTHLETVREELKEEKGIKPIIGIDIANKMCKYFGYQPLQAEFTSTWDPEFHYIKEGKNRFGFLVTETGSINFEQDYPYLRDEFEDYLIEGNVNDYLYHFSASLSKQEKPLLIQIEKNWYAFNEWTYGNYRSTLEQEDLKLIATKTEHYNGINFCDSSDKKYGQRVKEAIRNSVNLQGTMYLTKQKR